MIIFMIGIVIAFFYRILVSIDDIDYANISLLISFLFALCVFQTTAALFASYYINIKNDTYLHRFSYYCKTRIIPGIFIYIFIIAIASIDDKIDLENNYIFYTICAIFLNDARDICVAVGNSLKVSFKDGMVMERIVNQGSFRLGLKICLTISSVFAIFK
jgi:hypothetical protein